MKMRFIARPEREDTGDSPEPIQRDYPVEVSNALYFNDHVTYEIRLTKEQLQEMKDWIGED